MTNDKGFVTGSVSGNTVTINGASTTWTNTWRGIQDNLTSSSTSDSLSANQGRILKSLVDGKANYSDLSDLCRFNFVNSVSECNINRINFLLRCPDSIIHLDPLDSYPDGTILLITIDNDSAHIMHRSGIWYSCGDSMDKNDYYYTIKSEINLITKNNGTIHHYKFN